MISFSSNAACTDLKFILYGENLDPQAVSVAFGMSAAKSFKKGDVFCQGKALRKHGMWSCKINLDGCSISDAIASFVDSVPTSLFPINNIENVESGKIVIWLNIPNDGSTFEFSIDPIDIERLNKLGVQLYMTVFPDIDDD